MPYVIDYIDNRAEREERTLMRLRVARPTLYGEHAGYESIGRFVGELVDAYIKYVRACLYPCLKDRYEHSEPSARRDEFPYSVTLICVCSEAAWSNPVRQGTRELFSMHFSSELASADREYTSLALRSFVFDVDSGFVQTLSDVAGRRLASKRRGWSFYLSKGMLRLYKTDRHGKVKKREKYPT